MIPVIVYSPISVIISEACIVAGNAMGVFWRLLLESPWIEKDWGEHVRAP